MRENFTEIGQWNLLTEKAGGRMFVKYSLTLVKKNYVGVGPVVQRLSSHVLLLGGPEFAGSDPGCRYGVAWQTPCCGRRPTYKVEEDGNGC